MLVSIHSLSHCASVKCVIKGARDLIP